MVCSFSVNRKTWSLYTLCHPYSSQTRCLPCNDSQTHDNCCCIVIANHSPYDLPMLSPNMLWCKFDVMQVWFDVMWCYTGAMEMWDIRLPLSSDEELPSDQQTWRTSTNLRRASTRDSIFIAPLQEGKTLKKKNEGAQYSRTLALVLLQYCEVM